MKYPIEYTREIEDIVDDLRVFNTAITEGLPELLPFLREQQPDNNYALLRELHKEVKLPAVPAGTVRHYYKIYNDNGVINWFVGERLWHNYQLPADDLVMHLVIRLCVKQSVQWETGTVLKVFFTNRPPDAVAARIINTANIWGEYGNVRFEESLQNSDSDVRVSFIENDGNWSCLGKKARRASIHEATMNLDPSIFTDQKEFDRAILHEFGHALGLVHEHQSPKAKLKWRKKHVYEEMYKINGWDRRTVKENLFKEECRWGTNYSQLDPESIMAYYIPKDYTKQGTEFRRNYELSETDKKYIGIFYPF